MKIWKAVKTGELASKTCRVTKAPGEVHPLVDNKLLWYTLKNDDVFPQIEMEAIVTSDRILDFCSDASRRRQGKIAKRAKASTSPYQCLQIPRSGGREMAEEKWLNNWESGWTSFWFKVGICWHVARGNDRGNLYKSNQAMQTTCLTQFSWSINESRHLSNTFAWLWHWMFRKEFDLTDTSPVGNCRGNLKCPKTRSLLQFNDHLCWDLWQFLRKDCMNFLPILSSWQMIDETFEPLLCIGYCPVQQIGVGRSCKTL